MTGGISASGFDDLHYKITVGENMSIYCVDRAMAIEKAEKCVIDYSEFTGWAVRVAEVNPHTIPHETVLWERTIPDTGGIRIDPTWRIEDIERLLANSISEAKKAAEAKNMEDYEFFSHQAHRYEQIFHTMREDEP